MAGGVSSGASRLQEGTSQLVLFRQGWGDGGLASWDFTDLLPQITLQMWQLTEPSVSPQATSPFPAFILPGICSPH